MNNRPIASLSPTLLARKGGARPAMRPQVAPMRQFHDNTARQLDDLGWNDMGHEAEMSGHADEHAEEHVQEQQGAEIVAFNPAAGDAYDDTYMAEAPVPEVLLQQEEIAERIAQDPTQPRRSALAAGRRAAFTLRLDGERHLKLRLACVTSSRSAQQLVTEALDRLIAELPDVAELAAKVGKRR